jgi:hypothetical protein
MRSSLIKVISGLFVVSCGVFTVEGATLTDWRRAGTNLSFHLVGPSNTTFLIQRSSNLVDWETVARNGNGGTDRFFQFTTSNAQPASHFFRAATTNEPLFGYALAALRGVYLNGNNVEIDSFDSSNPAYSTDGRWDINKRRDHGDVASNDNSTNTIFVGNAEVFGRIHTGPGGTMVIGSNGRVGGVAWQAAGYPGTVQPGWSLDDADVSFPPVVMPETTWAAMPAGGTVNGTNFTYIFDSSGDYMQTAEASNLTGRILVSAPNVRLRVDSDLSLSLIQIETNASLIIYMNGTNASISVLGVRMVQGASAANLLYFGTSNNTNLDLGGNYLITGGFYAPSAKITFHGGGINDEDFSGSFVGNSINIVGHLFVHFDENLLRNGPKK